MDAPVCLIGDRFGVAAGSWSNPPRPPAQSKRIWLQSFVSFVLSWAVRQCRVTFFYCMKYQVCWKHWLELRHNALQDDLNCWEGVPWPSFSSSYAALIQLNTSLSVVTPWISFACNQITNCHFVYTLLTGTITSGFLLCWPELPDQLLSCHLLISEASLSDRFVLAVTGASLQCTTYASLMLLIIENVLECRTPSEMLELQNCTSKSIMCSKPYLILLYVALQNIMLIAGPPWVNLGSQLVRAAFGLSHKFKFLDTALTTQQHLVQDSNRLTTVILMSFLVLIQEIAQQKCGGMFGHAYGPVSMVVTVEDCNKLNMHSFDTSSIPTWQNHMQLYGGISECSNGSISSKWSVDIDASGFYATSFVLPRVSPITFKASTSPNSGMGRVIFKTVRSFRLPHNQFYHLLIEDP